MARFRYRRRSRRHHRLHHPEGAAARRRRSRLTALALRNVSYSYPGAANPALEEVSLAIQEGEFVLLCGASGGGKSTLLRAFSGLVPRFYGGSFSGEALIHERPLEAYHQGEIARSVGMVFQNPEDQIVASTVLADVAFGPENLAYPQEELSNRVTRALESAGIPELATASTRQLSAGQLQKVALAGILAIDPPILCLDEPTSQIDPISARDVIRLLARLAGSGRRTIVLSEHRLEFAAEVASRLVVVLGGRVVADGPPREVLADPRAFSWGLSRPRALELALRLSGEGLWEGHMPLSPDEFAEHQRRKSPGRTAITAVASGPVANAAINPSCAQAGMAAKEERDMEHEHFPTGVRRHAAEGAPLSKGDAPGAPVELRDLHFHFPGGPPILQGISMQLAAGQVMALMGRSGAGKSTLARHLNGLLRPTAGQVLLAGQDTRGLPVSDLAQRVGYLFQNPLHQLFTETVRAEVGLALKQRKGLRDGEVDRRVAEALAMFHLEGLAERHPLALSEGQRKRVAFASVLIARPQVLVLDEPTLGQDAVEKANLVVLIRRLAQEGIAILLITHDVDFAIECATALAVLRNGQLLAAGSMADLAGHDDLFKAGGLVGPQMALLSTAMHWESMAATLEQAHERIVAAS